MMTHYISFLFTVLPLQKLFNDERKKGRERRILKERGGGGEMKERRGEGWRKIGGIRVKRGIAKEKMALLKLSYHYTDTGSRMYVCVMHMGLLLASLRHISFTYGMSYQ